jgi:S-adenosyl methyltransferase
MQGRGNDVERPSWVPEGTNITVPNSARAYDYALGGYHNFQVDRDFLDRLVQALPGIRADAIANRALLHRVIRWLISQGVRQFLDIGSGVPTVGNVHEIAQELAPESRVVYVDIDPVAVAHGQAILAGNPWAWAIEGDLRRPADIVNHPDVLRVLDFSEPVAVILFLVVHYVADDDEARAIMAYLRDALVSGSYIVLTHLSPFPGLEEDVEKFRKLFDETPTPITSRSREQIADLLTGLDVVEPGIVRISEWHPEPGDESDPMAGAIGFTAVARRP